jgi:hypothetical protein
MRDDRRLNVLARGRLRARRGAEPRLSGDDDRRVRPVFVPQVSADESPAAQRLVAVLEPVLGCRHLAEPPAPATWLWLTPEC